MAPKKGADWVALKDSRQLHETVPMKILDCVAWKDLR